MRLDAVRSVCRVTVVATWGMGTIGPAVGAQARESQVLTQPIVEHDIEHDIEHGIAYGIEYRPHEDGSSLAVSIVARGLDQLHGRVGLHLPNWGDWIDVDDLYFRGFRCDPPAQRDPESPQRWMLNVPDEWSGTLEVSYTIPFIDLRSHAANRHGLFPWEVRSEDGGSPYAVITSRNTLMLVTVNGEPIEENGHVTVTAPPEYSIASGWAGVSLQMQSFVADLTTESPIVFGVAPKIARSEAGGRLCEVVQLSDGPDVTAALLEQASALTRAYAQTTGVDLRAPVRIFVTDKGGGQRVDHGLMMQAASDGYETSPYYRQLMAHELFHDWLGGEARGVDASTTWFLEGFTDYLSLWHMVALDQVTPAWFARRMNELNDAARASEAFGHVAFGDPNANWRDWDGPNETLAYKGGAVLAFALDAELRRAGQPGLSRMIGDFARADDGVYTPQSISDWLTAHGLADFHRDYIAAPALPDWRAVLESAGFALAEQPVTITCCGIQCDGDTRLGTITAIDPDGPAAGIGLQVGDRITGLWPASSAPPRIGAEVTTSYRFALDLADPAATVINVGIIRDGAERTVQITPRAIPGGWEDTVIATETSGQFFAMPQ